MSLHIAAQHIYPDNNNQIRHPGDTPIFLKPKPAVQMKIMSTSCEFLWSKCFRTLFMTSQWLGVTRQRPWYKPMITNIYVTIWRLLSYNDSIKMREIVVVVLWR